MSLLLQIWVCRCYLVHMECLFRMTCPDHYSEVIQPNWECLLLPKLHRQRKLYMCRER